MRRTAERHGSGMADIGFPGRKITIFQYIKPAVVRCGTRAGDEQGLRVIPRIA
jgi:hypothetical protein